jgi:DNA-binding MarR family transcriptional regulator
MTQLDVSAATELRESVMAVARQLRRHRPDHGLTLSQMQVLAEVTRTGAITPAELATRMQIRVQSLTDSINGLVSAGLASRRADDVDRRRQLVEITAEGTALLAADRDERDAWLDTSMRENLTDLEFGLLLLVAPVLRKLADAEAGRIGT